MTEPGRREHELAAFLRSRRERRSPESVGLDRTRRRRTPGLRREEVAAMAGVSTSWYTWLEQGREIHASRQVLSALAVALGLDAMERAHLFDLAEEVPPGGERPVAQAVPAEYRLLLDQLDPSPAFLVNRRFDLLAWNRGVCSIFGDPGLVSPDDRNVLWLLFTSPAARALHDDWAAEAAHAVALFRAQAGDGLIQPEFAALVRRLEAASEDFRRLWGRRDLVAYRPGKRVLNHQALGPITLEHVKMHSADGAYTLVAYLTPAGSPAAAALAAAAGSLASPAPGSE